MAPKCLRNIWTGLQYERYLHEKHEQDRAKLEKERVDRDRSKRREAASEGGQKRPSSRQHRQHSHHTNAALQGQPATEKHERDISESVRSDPRYDVIFFTTYIRGCQLADSFCQYR